MFGRRVVGLLAASAALVVAFVAGTGSLATATQGQPVISGAENSQTNGTTICQLSQGTCGFVNSALYAQTDAAGAKGVVGRADIGVLGDGSGAGVGVRGEAGAGGTGVFGTHSGTTGIGVNGVTAGIGSGVYGQATGTGGVGVFGDSASGTGVLARSTGSGLALDVSGMARFSSSGVATINGTAAAPKKSVVVTGVSLSAMSFILATAQKAVGGVWVRAVVPNVAGNSIKIFLSKAVTTSVPVAWLVIERP